MDLVPGALGGHVEHDPDAAGTDPPTASSRADEGHRPQPHRAGRGGRKGGDDVLGGREENGDDVVFDQFVAVEDLLRAGSPPGR